MNKLPDEYFEAEKNLLTPKGKKIMAWFKRPLKKVGKLYGVTFITVRPLK